MPTRSSDYISTDKTTMEYAKYMASAVGFYAWIEFKGNSTNGELFVTYPGSQNRDHSRINFNNLAELMLARDVLDALIMEALRDGRKP